MPDWKYLDLVFLYDGTFYGLLTIVFDSYIAGKIPIKICSDEEYEYNLLDKTCNIKTDEVKAKRVFDGIIKNISADVLFIAYRAFLSGQRNKELPILKFLLSGFKLGSRVCNMLAIDYVMDTMKLSKNTGFEAHRLKGLVKFRCINNNLYYAPIHPDNNVIEIVGTHFIKRFPKQIFILHDKNRNIAFTYNTKEYSIIDVPAGFKVPEYSEEEKLYQELWKTFFKSIAIKERTNKRLQMQFMPKKYWQDLVETE